MATLALSYNNQYVLQIPVNQIYPNPNQPRKKFENKTLDELAESIKEYGVMQPISVRIIDDKYELVAGERRLRASKIAGLLTIPAIVVEACQQDSAFMAMMENLQRENLSFFEEAEGYQKLIHDYGLTQEEVAVKLGKSQSSVANKIRLLKLPGSIKDIISENGLTERHARALLKIPDETTQLKVLDEIVESKLNVNTTDSYVNSILAKTPEKKPKKADIKKFKIYIKDSRIYINTIKKAVELIKQSGGEASYIVKDREELVEVIVSIKKKT